MRTKGERRRGGEERRGEEGCEKKKNVNAKNEIVRRSKAKA